MRLTGHRSAISASHGYDPAGNRSTKGSTAYSYDRADRITPAGSTSYTMDANGNLTARGADSFTYDQANRLKTASVGGTASAYSCDGDGKRASKTVAGAPTNYTYDVNASLPVLLDDGTRKYVWGLGLAFAVDASGNPLVYHADGLGSVRALTDSSGTVVQSYLYDEYGNVLSSSGSITQPFTPGSSATITLSSSICGLGTSTRAQEDSPGRTPWRERWAPLLACTGTHTARITP